MSSERYRSAEQLLERHIRDMGEELGRVYNELSSELSRLYLKWDLYRQLYARSPRRIELLNQAAGYLFSVLHRRCAAAPRTVNRCRAHWSTREPHDPPAAPPRS